MEKNAIYVWIGLAVLFVILWNANKRKEDKVGVGGAYQRFKDKKIYCYCNEHFVGEMTPEDCINACAPRSRSGTRPRYTIQHASNLTR